MSNTPTFAGNSGQSEERRAKVRQPVGALAYLDIGPDNGGILLNVSEDGLALQAVGPLHGMNEIQLGIQLPHSEARIEIAAEIVWLGASSRQAGVRFLNLSAEARTQIREWIESQPAISAGSVAQLPVPEPAAKPIEEDSPAAGPDGAPDSPREKWLHLMAEFERGTSPQEEEAAEALKAGTELVTEFAPSAPKRVPVLRPRPEIVPKPAIPTVGVEPALLARTSQVRASSLGTASPTEAVREQVPSRPSKFGDTGKGFAAKPAEPPATAREATTPRPSDRLPIETSIAPYAATSESNSDLARNATEIGSAEKWDDRKAEAREVPHDRARNQLILVALFALFSILCFAIGTWVGRIPTQVEAVKPAITPPTANAAVRSAASSSAPPVANPIEQPHSQIVRSTEVARSHGRTYRAGSARMLNAARTSQHQPGLSAQQQANAIIGPGEAEVALTPREQRQPTADRTSPALVSTDQPVGTASGAVSPAESSPAALSEENAQPPLVNGYVLRPSDRFVPCHLTYRLDPTYPLDAKQQGIEGTVKIHLAIAADGSVESEKVISGPPQLVPAALEAAKYWQYLPALLNGQPIPTETDVDIAFHVPR